MGSEDEAPQLWGEAGRGVSSTDVRERCWVGFWRFHFQLTPTFLPALFAIHLSSFHGPFFLFFFFEKICFY